MAKRLLLSALVEVFGAYLTGLSEDNLKVGVWRGQIALQNLCVKPEALAALQLPLSIVAGEVRAFQVSIPWTRLESQPVRVELTGLHLLAEPNDRRQWPPEAVERHALEARRKLLAAELQRALEAAAGDLSGDEGSQGGDGGYVKRLVTKIVDNLQVTIRDVHVRFEAAGERTALGVRIEALELGNAGGFTERGPADLVHKQLQLAGQAVYVDVGLAPEALLAARPAAALERLQQLPTAAHEYLLAPTTLTAALTHNDRGDAAQPLARVELDLGDPALRLSAEQFAAVLRVKQSFDAVARWERTQRFRPAAAPAADPRAWWSYAMAAVRAIGFPPRVQWGDFAALLQRRRAYLDLFSRAVRGEELAGADAERLQALEDGFEVQQVLVFRNVARALVRREPEQQRLRAEAAAAARVERERQARKKKGVFGRLFSRRSKDQDQAEEQEQAEEDDLDLGALITAAAANDDDDDADDAHNRTDGLLKLSATAAGTLTLRAQGDTGLATASFAANLDLHAKHDGDFQAGVRLTRLVVTDDTPYDAPTQHPELVALQSAELGLSRDAFTYRSDTLAVVFAPRCVQGLVDTFAAPELRDAQAAAYDRLRSLGGAGWAQARALQVDVDLQAPIVLVPADVCDPDPEALALRACLGRLSATSQPDGGYGVQLADVNLRLQDRALVPDFGVALDVALGDPTTTLRCRVEPRIDLNLTPADVVDLQTLAAGVALQTTTTTTTTSATATQQDETEDDPRQPDQVVLDLLLAVPAVSLRLSHNQHTLTAALTGIDVQLVQRPHDRALTLALAGLSLVDGQAREMATITSGERVGRVQVTSFASTLSPDFADVDTDVRAAFGGLRVMLSPGSFDVLQPFLAARPAAVGPTRAAAATAARAKAGAVDRTRVVYSSDALELGLRRRGGEPVVAAAMRGVAAEVRAMGAAADVHVSVTAFALTDERAVAAEREVRQLLACGGDEAVALDVRLQQRAAADDVTVTAGALTAHVVADALADVLEVVGDVAGSIGGGSPAAPAPAQEQARDQPKQQQQQKKNKKKEKDSRVALALGQPTLMLHDAKLERAIVIRSAVSATFEHTAATGVDMLDASVEALESFMALSATEIGRRILDPVSVSLALRARQEASKEVHFSVTPVSARVTYQQALLVSHILTAVQPAAPSDAAAAAPTDEAVAAALLAETVAEQEPDQDQGTKREQGHMKLSAALPNVLLQIVDDCGGRDTPLLRADLHDVVWSMQDGDGSGAIHLGVDFFHPGLAAWEPVVEPAQLTVDLRGSRHVQLRAPELQLVVTTRALATLSDAARLWDERSALTTAETTYHDVFIANRCGEPFVAAMPGVAAVEVPPGGEAPVDAPPTLLLSSVDFAERSPLRSLPVDEPGVAQRQLHHLSAAGADYVHPVVEECYENQRLEVFTQRWKKPYLPADRPNWTDREATVQRTRESVQPPRDWAWLDEWTVDRSGAVDEDGWEYAVDLSGFSTNPVQRTKRAMDCARRRRWVRTRAPAGASAQDPGRPLPVFVRVAVAEGVRTISVESRVRVVNESPYELDLGAAGVAPAFATHFVPMALADAPELELAGDRVSLREAPATVVAPRAGVRVATAQEDCGQLVVTVSAPVAVRNLLPCPVDVRVRGGAGQEALGVRAGASAYFNAPAADALSVRLRASDSWSEWAPLAAGRVRVAPTLELTLTAALELRASHWVVDETSAGLQLGSKGRPAGLPVTRSVVEVFEHERLSGGEWRTPQDRPRWAPAASPGEAAPPPGWRWTADWVEHAWEYGQEFAIAERAPRARQRPGDCVRRRRLVRECELDPRHAARPGHAALWLFGGKSLAVSADGGSTYSASPLDVSKLCATGPFGDWGVGVRECPGAFAGGTKLVRIIPRFVVYNGLAADELLLVRRAGGDDAGAVDPGRGVAYHPRGQPLEFSFDGVAWTGGVDVAEFGATPLQLPGSDVVLLVNVKLDAGHRDSLIQVVVERESPLAPVYRVHNAAADVAVSVVTHGRALAPGEACAFGWRGSADKTLELAVGSGRPVRVDPDAVGGRADLGGGVRAVVRAVHGTKVVCVLSTGGEAPPQPATAPAVEPDQSFALTIDAVGVSLVAAQPEMRELFFLAADGVEATASQTGELRTAGLAVGALQVDNDVPEAVFPVLLHSSSSSGDQQGPALQASVVRRAGAEFRLVGLQLQPLELKADTATVFALLRFLQEGSVGAALMHDPQGWAAGEANRLARALRFETPQLGGGGKFRLYFERLQLMSMRVNVTFVQMPARADGLLVGRNVVALLENMTQRVDDVALCVNALILEHALLTPQMLQQLLLSHYKAQLQAQAVKVVGSLAVLGNPVGLLSNVASGVTDLFIEPYQGALQSPEEFVAGIGKGASSLVSGAVGGAVGSAAGVTRSVAGNVALLAMDHDYAERRTRRVEQGRAGGGFLGGLASGGESVLRGVASGVTGLATAPVRGAREGGVGGALAGFGKGLAGLVVKPVVGVVDAASGVLDGVQDQVSQRVVARKRRLPRAFHGHRQEVRAYSPRAARAQEQLRAYNGGALRKRDRYVAHFAADDGLLIVTTRRALRPDQPGPTLTWAKVARVELVDGAPEVRLHAWGAAPVRLRFEAPTSAAAADVAAVLGAVVRRFGVASDGPPEQEQGEEEAKASPQDDDDAYTAFGAFNRHAFPEQSLSNGRIVALFQQRLARHDLGDGPQLDQALTELVRLWDCNHTLLAARRCLAVAVLNRSARPLQLQQVRLEDGDAVHTLAGAGYDEASRALAPRGVVVVFAWGATVSPFKKGHVRVRLQATAFNAYLSDTRVELTPTAGASRFLERTQEEWVAKFVVEVS